MINQPNVQFKLKIIQHSAMLHFVIVKLFSDKICENIDREPKDVMLAE